MSKFTDIPFSVFRVRSRKIPQQTHLDYAPALGAGGLRWVEPIHAIRRRETRRRLVVETRLPELNEYPFIAQSAAVTPASFEPLVQYRTSFKRLLQPDAVHYGDRPFPYPSYLAPDTFYRHKTRFSWQGVEQDEWPEASNLVELGHPQKDFQLRRVRSRKLLQTPQHDVWTETTPPVAPVFAALDISVKANRFKEIGQFLQPSILGSYQETDPAYYSGWYPAQEAAQRAHRVWFERKHLRDQQVNDFPATPAPPAPDYVATVTELAHHVESKRTLQTTEHNVWPFKDVDEFGISATLIEKAFRRQELRRSLRLVPQHDEWTATPAVPIVTLYPAELPSGFHRRHQVRHLRTVRELDNFTPFEPDTSKDPLIVQAENTIMTVAKENTTMIVRKENTTLVA